MNNIPVITDKEELYAKCENMEQLFDKYYLPLLDKHYSKVYQLQQENQELKADYGNKSQVERDLLLEENQELKDRIKDLELIVGIKRKRSLISKFNKEYDEEDKKKNPNRTYTRIEPDAEEVYKRYYDLKKQLTEKENQQKEFINWLKAMSKMYEEQYKDIDVVEHYNCVFAKYKEIIEGKNVR